MTEKPLCPNCEAGEMYVFYEMRRVPVHSVLLLNTREEALSYPTGDIALGFCPACGFVSNVAFDPALHEYSARYEATQGYSPTFNTFARRLAGDLVARHDLHGRDIIEIGCGQGEFLALLCELGGNRGIGFDPAYRGAPTAQVANNGQLTFIADFYGERYTRYRSDFVCCRMTLEHIQPTAAFVRTVRRAIGDSDAVVFFQVPNAAYVLGELAFWDVYYEHCSYFSPGALARLFRRCGFDVHRLWTDYDDQYLMIEARPGNGRATAPLPEEDDLAALAQSVARFSQQVPRRLAAWRQRLDGIRRAGQRAVIWGGGSKGVAFLTALNVRDEIEYVVDINPNKHGTFMAGTGQEIVPPEFLKRYQPDVVIVMNPVYCGEIQQDLDRMGVQAALLAME